MAIVESKISGNLGVLVINNPPRNALSAEVFRALESEFENLQRNDAVEVIIFTGTGIAFSTGADVKMIFELLKSGAREKIRELIWGVQEFFLKIDHSLKPTIAAVNGFCLGGGLELALACDYILAVPNAQFGFPEVTLGIIPGLGGTQRSVRRVGVKNGMRMVVSGQFITSDTALSIGLLDQVLKGDFIAGIRTFADEVTAGTAQKKAEAKLLDGEMEELAQDFGVLAKGRPFSAVKCAEIAIRNGAKASDLQLALMIELDCFMEALFTDDAKEGLTAYLEKRSPKFSAVFGEKPKIAAVAEEKLKAEEEPVSFADQPPWEKEEYKMLRAMVRDFAREKIAPQVKEMEKNQKVPAELIKQMADLGLFGVSFPEKYGGAGLGKIGVCVLADELSYVHPSTAVVLGAHTSLGCEAVFMYGNEDQKTRYLVPGLKGELIGALATTESNIGSDVGAMKTMAKKVDGGWLVNGAKQFITNGEIADFVIVFAQTDPLGGNKTLIAFIVDTNSQGFEITKREDKIGIHASNTNSFALDNVFVPEANVLGEPGQGFKMVMHIFNHSRITLTASCLGFMRRAIDEAISFSKSRSLFGEPMWMKQNTQLKLAEMEATRFMVEAMVYEGAWMIDRGLDVRTAAAAIKYWGPELANKVVDMSLQLHGGAGYIEDLPIAMFYRDIRIFRLFEGTSEVQLLTIAKEMIKSRFL